MPDGGVYRMEYNHYISRADTKHVDFGVLSLDNSQIVDCLKMVTYPTGDIRVSL